MSQLRTVLNRFADAFPGEILELTSADVDEWFGILPKPGQWENTFDWDRRARVVTLPVSDGA